jgi:pimeloyl-ACP methyl ester carboxylesterase
MAQSSPEFPALPLPLAGDYVALQTDAGRVAVYRGGPMASSAAGGPNDGVPLLLVHSVNAAACAAEVAPLFDHYRRTRAVYALDLPGYGLSDRSDRAYTPRLMTDALHAVVKRIREENGGGRVDVLGVSLSCEYVARLHSEAPNALRRIALVSPTGFSGNTRRYGPPGSTRGIAWLYKVLANPAWSGALFNALTRPGVIRYFLQRTFGTKQINESLWRYDVLTTRQPGAKHAPLYFLGAYLFSNDINSLYEAVDCPVWVSMATRGDFTDYRGRSTVEGRPNWQFHLFDGGALPYFERPAAFTALLDTFLD